MDKRTRPRPDPDTNGEHRAMWRMLDWLADEMRDGRKERRQFQAAMLIALLGGVLAVVLK